jgi:hypothetical protein
MNVSRVGAQRVGMSDGPGPGASVTPECEDGI